MSNPSTTTQPVTSPSHSPPLRYQTYTGSEIDDAVLAKCADLFSNNYGIWGEDVAKLNIRGLKPGHRVKMSVARLRQELSTSLENTILVVCYPSDHQDAGQPEPVGHAFATAWDYEGGRVGWVTQLVVSATMRRKRIATTLLQTLKSCPPFHGITAIGLASSHPAACNALANYTSTPIQSIDMGFLRQNAKPILERSPIEYVQKKELRGSLFEDDCTSGAVSCVFTSFYVDHAEPLEALSAYEARGQWRLGELPEGHEFLIIVPV